MALHAYDHVMEKGRPLGLKNCGLKGANTFSQLNGKFLRTADFPDYVAALGSLRMEKAYRDYGHDMDNTDTLMEVGLSFTCDFAKPGGFIGDAAVKAQKEQGGVKSLKQRLVQVLVKDPHPFLFHAEPVFRDGKAQGYVRAGSYGHTLGGAVGLCMLQRNQETDEPINKAYLESGRWEVEIAGTRYDCALSLSPMYDPKNLKIKA